MRKIISALFASLDGVTEAPNLWQFDHFDEDMMESMISQLAQIDTVMMGRVTYQEWAGYWPTATDPFAQFINPVPKYVVSSTLKTLDWQNSRLLTASLADTIAELKAQPGKNIAIQGSPTLVRSLLQANLLDELILMVHPVVVGKGKRLFEGAQLQRLELVSSQTTRSGVVLLTYRPRPEQA